METATAQLVITPLWSTDVQFNAVEEEINSYHIHDAYLKVLQFGDIDQFLWRNVSDPGFGTFRHWVMAMSPMVGNYPLGIFLDNGLAAFGVMYNLVVGFRCEAGLWVHPDHRGGMSREIGKKWLESIHALDIPTVWAYTPWQRAMRFFVGIGMKPTAKLPSYLHKDGAMHDVFVLRHEVNHGRP